MSRRRGSDTVIDHAFIAGDIVQPSFYLCSMVPGIEPRFMETPISVPRTGTGLRQSDGAGQGADLPSLRLFLGTAE